MRLFIGILISVLSLTYLLPTGIAIARKRTNTMAIFVLNLFLGWTLVGWVVALTWSVAKDEK
ncbi:MAG: superinfection immunity protein [Patescibacteria group bacterium]